MARSWGRAGTVLALTGGLVAPMAVVATADEATTDTPEVSVQELDLTGVAAAEVAALPDEAPLPAEELDSSESDLAEADVTGAAAPVTPATDAVFRTASVVDDPADAAADQPAPDATAPAGEPAATEAPAPTPSAEPTAPAPSAPATQDPGSTPEPTPTTPTEELPAPDVLTRELDTEPYSVLGVTWDAAPDLDGVVIRYRYRTAGTWTDWEAAGASDIAPDSTGADSTGERGATDPIVAVDADGLQIWAEAASGTVTGLKAVLIDPGEDPAPVVADVVPSAATDGATIAPAVARTADSGAVRPAAAYPSPSIISRAAWGADESLRSCQSDVSTQMVSAAVHHTASSNSYAAADVPGLIRGFYAYHTRSEASGGRGWCDIGYNMLVDKFGRVFEGRAGSIDQTIVGVHTGGFNSRTFGVSAIGEYGSAAAPAAMLEAISQTIAWKFAQLRVRANATVSMVSGGGATRYPAGTVVTFPTIYGHRDAAQTSCPGQNLYNSLGAIRARVAQLVDAGVAASPTGSWDALTVSGSTATVRGWMHDPDLRGPVYVAAYVNGVRTEVLANVSRPDVAAAVPTAGPNQGYQFSVPLSGGRNVICLWGYNAAGAGYDTTLGCRTASVSNQPPVGQFEAASASNGRITVSGWALDRDTTAPLGVAVYVDGRGYWTTTQVARPDVARAVAGAGPNQGFSLSVPAASGNHQVCVVAVNSPAGANTSLGCRTVALDAELPQGNFESVTGKDGRVTVSGWAFDADTTSPVGLAVYVDGRGYWTTTQTARPDVARVVKGAGPNQGFSLSVPADFGGVSEVCITAINSPSGPNVSLGCRRIALNARPVGNFESLTAVPGGVQVVGWAHDADVTGPVTLSVFVDGRGYLTTTGVARADVASAVPGAGPSRGFRFTAPAPAGRHEVCVIAENMPSGGAAAHLGCRTVGS
ncbi:MAG: N-acetylmuramoyl-L-alanine amidase [Cellulomonas sp.]